MTEIQNKILEIISQIDKISGQNEDPLIEKTLQNLESLTEQSDSYDKKTKANILFQKGRLLFKIKDLKKAEENLSKALKLNPTQSDYWDILGQIYWQKGDYEGSKSCYESAIEINKTPLYLRNLSMVLRCVGQSVEESKSNVQKSVEIAKNALNMDLNDGESWYVLGNAYMKNFFASMKTIKELNNALKAYDQAEKFLKKKNPDLYFNRGTIQQYLEEYNAAIQDFKLAHSLDAQLQSNLLIQNIEQKVSHISSVIENNVIT